jgi:hypothetical protein
LRWSGVAPEPFVLTRHRGTTKNRACPVGVEETAAMADDLETLKNELQELRDMEEIKRLRALVIRYVDARDWDAWATLLTEDFYFDSDAGIHEGREEVIAMVSSALSDASTVHHVYAPDIKITGPDTASASWRMEDWVRMNYQGTPMAMHGHGFYHEDYVRTDDGWRLKKCVMERIRVDPIEGEATSVEPAGR